MIKPKAWDIREIIDEVNRICPDIESIYLFGSRRYNTQSRRSDIDLLALASKPFNKSILTHHFEAAHPADIFVSYDNIIAESVGNGSVLSGKSGPLNETLDAILLWTKSDGLNLKFNDWIQLTDPRIEFVKTVIPGTAKAAELFNYTGLNLEAQGLPTSTFLGGDWEAVARKMLSVVSSSVVEVKNLRARTNTSFGPQRLLNEYDFQNCIHIVLKPWISDLKVEPFQIEFGASKKMADFGFQNNSVVIEAKHIDSRAKANQVQVDIEGLTTAYLRNPRIRLLLFLVLLENDVSIPTAELEHQLSKSQKEILVRTYFIRN